MRTPFSKVYRAFPVLDRYDDAQCKRFMRSVRQRTWQRVGRVSATICATAIGQAVSFYIFTHINRSGLLSGSLSVAPGRFPVTFIVVTGVLLFLGFVPGIYVRDRLLLGQIKRILGEGCCPECRYTLIGLPVDAQGKVQCAECGASTDVDPALGELVVNESGRQIYQARPRLREHSGL